MKRFNNKFPQTPEQWISQSPQPSPEQMEFRINRVWDRVQSEIDDQPLEIAWVPRRRSRAPQLAVALTAAALIALVVVLPAVFGPRLWRNSPAAHVETAGGGLFRGDPSSSLNSGMPIQFGESIRSSAGAGAVFVLADKSRVEMRPNSQLILEHADDGLRIRLNSGSVIVTAAKQRSGHLYVQTRDVTVSVVGTVFLVNAEEAGSRVAVIQGEVQVQDGSVLKKLVPGEQVATNPLMESHPVREEIAWSSSAPAHMALLEREQSAPPRMEFEAAIVKPVGPRGVRPNLACRGTDGIFSIIRTAGVLGDGGLDPSTVPQGRCVGAAFLREMIAAAYDVRGNRVSGDPQAMYQVEAKAEDTDNATLEQLRQMFQNFVADQFKLKIHRETAEEDGYVLHVAKRGLKLEEATGDVEAPHLLRRPGAPPPLGESLQMTVEARCSLKTFAQYLSALIGGQPVVDTSDLTGIYDIRLTLNRLPGDGGPRGRGTGNTYDPPVTDALEDQLGLRLESRKVPVEYLVVDHIEMPSTN